MDKVTRQYPQTTTSLRERRAEAVSSRGPSAYQPNALPLGQTGSRAVPTFFIYFGTNPQSAVQSTLHRPNITMCPRVLSHLFVSICVCATDVWSRSSFRVSKFTFLNVDVGKTIDRVQTTHQTHFGCRFWLHSLYSWWVWWFSQLFQWFLRFKWTKMHTIWSGWARKTNKTKQTTVGFVTPYWRSSI